MLIENLGQNDANINIKETDLKGDYLNNAGAEESSIINKHSFSSTDQLGKNPQIEVDNNSHNETKINDASKSQFESRQETSESPFSPDDKKEFSFDHGEGAKSFFAPEETELTDLKGSMPDMHSGLAEKYTHSIAGKHEKASRILKLAEAIEAIKDFNEQAKLSVKLTLSEPKAGLLKAADTDGVRVHYDNNLGIYTISGNKQAIEQALSKIYFYTDLYHATNLMINIVICKNHDIVKNGFLTSDTAENAGMQDIILHQRIVLHQQDGEYRQVLFQSSGYSAYSEPDIEHKTLMVKPLSAVSSPQLLLETENRIDESSKRIQGNSYSDANSHSNSVNLFSSEKPPATDSIPQTLSGSGVAVIPPRPDIAPSQLTDSGAGNGGGSGGGGADLQPGAIADNNAAANSLAENSANGTVVGITAHAVDPEGAAITYSLTDDAGGRFAINATTGVVTIANSTLLDFETATSYVITVSASDGTSTPTTQNVTINLTNVNEAPAALADSNLAANSVTENAANGTVVGITAVTADPDGTVITYSLTDNAGGRFAIDATTGIVTVANGSLLNYEAATSHSITVQATDGVNPVTQIYTINLGNVDELPGALTDSNASANAITEGAANGTLVGITAATSDPEGVAVTYSLTDSAGGRFAIDATTGVVSLADTSLIDYSTNTSHVITVSATDGTTAAVTQNYTITVSDPSNAPPAAITDSNVTANTVNENAANGTAVGVTAFTTDPEGVAITYSLTDNAGGRFAIDSTTGVVTVANSSLLNYEAATSHNIVVQASDGVNNVTQGYTINLNNVDEQPGAITDSNATANNLAENSANGTVVAVTALTTDPEAVAIVYSLSDDAGGRFAINSSTGVVTVANSALLDYEAATSHVITVSATDGTTAAVTQNFTINLTNVNESPVAITDSNAAANSVTENAANGTVVGVTGFTIDPEGTAIVYSLTDNAGGRFAINSSTGVVTVANGSLLDFETLISHTITIQATDGVNPVTQNYTINLTDANESPVHGGLAASVTFMENTVNAGAQLIDSAQTLTDVDSADFNGGFVTVAWSSGGAAQDQLGVQNIGNGAGQIGVAGATVSYGGTAIGTITSNGVNGAALTISFNASSTVAGVKALLEAINYANTSDTPNAARTASITINDGDSSNNTVSSIIVNVTPEAEAGVGTDFTLTAGTDNFTGGAFVDTFTGLTANLNTADTLVGGAGSDSLIITDSASIASATWANKTGIDQLVLQAGATSLVFNDVAADQSDSGDRLIVNNGTTTITSLNTSAVSASNMIIIAGTGSVTTTAGVNSRVYSADGVNTSITGGTGNDTLIGGTGNDTLNGGSGSDSVNGGAGSDRVNTTVANFVAGDTLVGGAGSDTLAFTSAGTIGSALFANKSGFETILLANGVNSLTLNAGYTIDTGTVLTIDATAASGSAQTIDASANSTQVNILSGGANDTLTGGSGNDSISGGSGNDSINGSAGQDMLTGGAGSDIFVFSAISDSAFATPDTIADFNIGQGDQIDLLGLGFTGIQAGAASGSTLGYTNDGVNTTIVDAANTFKIILNGVINPTGSIQFNAGYTFTGATDNLIGDAGDNNFVTMAANFVAADTATGGAGFDVLTFQNAITLTPALMANKTGIDAFQLGSTGSTLQIDDAMVDATDGGAVLEIQNSTYTVTLNTASVTNAANFVRVAGTGQVTLQNANNRIYGKDGVDVNIVGGTGADTIVGGTGNDTLDGGSGNDSVNAGAGSDRFNTTRTNFVAGDTLVGGAGSDTLSITTAGTVGSALFANKSGFETILLANGTNSLTLNAGYTIDTGTVLTIDATAALGSAQTIDTSANAIRVTILSGGGADTLTGGSGNDSISGGNGADSMIGGAGADTLTGGAGADIFRFTAIAHSAFATPDTITDFSVAQGDLLSLIGMGFTGIQAGAASGTILGYTNDGVNTTLVDVGNTFKIILAGVVDLSVGLVLNNPFSLTAGIDNPAGGSANDIFTGALTSLQAADTLVGGGGRDTLVITTAGTIGAVLFANKSGIETIQLANGANSLTLSAGYTIDTGTVLTIDAGAAGSSTQTINTSANALQVNITSSTGDDVITTGTASDTINADDGWNQINAGGGNNLVTTLGGPDTITAGAGDDTISAGDGDNRIDAGGGNNVIITTDGWDNITVGGGDDTISAGEGKNNITAGEGNNKIDGGTQDDTITSGAGNDTINASDGNNTISAGDGNNVITTTDGWDNITVGGGDDTISAGDGNNNITAGEGNNKIDGGTQDDTITSGAGNDTINASDGWNRIDAGGGNNIITTTDGWDNITVGGGDDTISAGEGSNNIIAGEGNNQIDAGTQNDTITSGAGNDTINASDGNNTISAGDGNNIITTTDGWDNITVGGGDDTISAGEGSNNIIAGEGNNQIDAGTQNDTITSGAGNDTINASDGNNTISAGDGNNIITTTNGWDNITTGIGNDTITAGDGEDYVSAGAGDDRVNSKQAEFSANDTLLGGAGSDTLAITTAGTIGSGLFVNKSGFETILLANGVNSLTLNAGYTIDTGTVLTIDATAATASSQTINTSANSIRVNILGGGAADTLTGGSGNDFLSGGSGNDRLTTGTGNDTLDGGAGADNLVITGSTVQIRYTGISDGAAAGANTGHDTVTGFSGDMLMFGGALNGGANDLDDITNDDNFQFVTNAAANFNTTHEGLIVSGLTNADLTQAGFTNVLTAINALGVTAANGQDGLILVNGATQGAIYLYQEAEGGGNTAVTAAELRLLATFDSAALGAGNFDFY